MDELGIDTNVGAVAATSGEQTWLETARCAKLGVLSAASQGRPDSAGHEGAGALWNSAGLRRRPRTGVRGEEAPV